MVTIKCQHANHPPLTLIVDPFYLPTIFAALLDKGYELIEVK